MSYTRLTAQSIAKIKEDVEAKYDNSQEILDLSENYFVISSGEVLSLMPYLETPLGEEDWGWISEELMPEGTVFVRPNCDRTDIKFKGKLDLISFKNGDFFFEVDVIWGTSELQNGW